MDINGIATLSAALCSFVALEYLDVETGWDVATTRKDRTSDLWALATRYAVWAVVGTKRRPDSG